MLLPSLAILAGLAILIWSADRFVDGASAIALHFGMPPLLIGMVIVGFGTSAPEMVVSTLAAFQGTPGIALGNAYGSNIANIALILGITALISPIIVESQVVRRELPLLSAVTAVAALQLQDNVLSRNDAWILLALFACLMGWSIWRGTRKKSDDLGREVAQELKEHPMTLQRALIWLAAGLLFLIAGSRLLVWGAVDIARSLGVNDLFIGLTIVAVGTSLPELASSIAAARKGEHDIALGNVLGSNLFNTLAVVGIAGVISPLSVGPEVFSRDILVMALLTLSLFVFGYGFRGPGSINRVKGGILIAVWCSYTIYLLKTAF